MFKRFITATIATAVIAAVVIVPATAQAATTGTITANITAPVLATITVSSGTLAASSTCASADPEKAARSAMAEEPAPRRDTIRIRIPDCWNEQRRANARCIHAAEKAQTVTGGALGDCGV